MSIEINNITNKFSLLIKGEKNKIAIGRLSSCDIVIPEDKNEISRTHCIIESKSDGTFFLHDQSTNGTFIKKQKVLKRSVKIGIKEYFVVGQYKFSISGQFQDLYKEAAVKSFGIEKVYNNEFKALHSSSVDMKAGSLIAIMGPSGCGKSTLLKTLNGESPASKGVVKIFGFELEENYDFLKNKIGYVPQDDIIHKELTVKQSLYYAAKIRLDNASEIEIENKIKRVLSELDIWEKRDDLVSSLSGGQRKRVSIAVELLSDPWVLFLDEPTSPLDPQTIENFLGILRKLANNNTTVVMVTHKPEDLAYMDELIILSQGGHMVYQGSAKNYLDYFESKSPVEVYAKLVDKSAHPWIVKYNEEHNVDRIIESSSKRKTTSKVNSFKQFYWLSRRYLNIKLNDQINSLILVMQAPIIAVLICLIFDNITQGVPFLITISAIWFGTNNAAREIVAENAIYKRERMFNLKILPYLFSKITIMSFFAILQATLFTLIIYYRYDSSEPNWNDIFSTITWMILVTFSATLMGLMLSSLVDKPEKVMSIVPISLIPQIMLAGVVAKITNPVVEIISYFTIARWGTEGLSIIQKEVYSEYPVQKSSGGLTNIIDSGNQIKNQFHSSYSDNFGDLTNSIELDFTFILMLSSIFFISIFIALKKKDSL